MSWVHVARKDFEDASRSKVLWGLAVVLVFLTAGLATVPFLLEDGSVPFGDALSWVYSAAGSLIPIIGLIVGYQAIVGERESGSIRFVLGLPHTRRDVVLGKLLGRFAVIAVATVIAFVVGAIVILGLYDEFVLADYLGLFVFVLVIGLVYLSIAIGVSASVSTRGRAILGVVGIYIVFDMIWQAVPMAIYWLIEGSLPELFGSGTLPAWFLLVERLSPAQSLGVIGMTLIDFVGTEDLDFSAAGRVAGDVPFYLENWFAWVIIIGWIVVPLTIGYVRFNRAVLN